jgi:hypothetical protein
MKEFPYEKLSSEPESFVNRNWKLNNSRKILKFLYDYLVAIPHTVIFLTEQVICSISTLGSLISHVVSSTPIRKRVRIEFICIMLFVLCTALTTVVLHTYCQKQAITANLMLTLLVLMYPLWFIVYFLVFVGSCFVYVGLDSKLYMYPYLVTGVLAILAGAITGTWGAEFVYDHLTPPAPKPDPYWLDPGMIVPVLEGSPTWGSLTVDQQTEVYLRANRAWLDYMRECNGYKRYAASYMSLRDNVMPVLIDDMSAIKAKIKLYDRIISGELTTDLMKPGAIAEPENFITVMQKIEGERQKALNMQLRGQVMISEIYHKSVPYPIKAPWHPRFNPLNIQRCM